MAESADLTRILEDLGRGGAGARDRLFAAVYEELRRLASAKVRREAPGRTLQTTALVHEAYLRLVDTRARSWENRAHFFGAASEAMRRILVDRARRRRAVKRGGGRERITLDDDVAADPVGEVDLLALDEALDTLAEMDPRKAEVVKLRYLLGLSVDETAEILGVSPRTVDNDWRFARAWLHRRLSDA